MDLRTAPCERDLIDRGVATSDTDLTDLVITQACIAARRVLADPDVFAFDDTGRVGVGQLSPDAIWQGSLA